MHEFPETEFEPAWETLVCRKPTVFWSMCRPHFSATPPYNDPMTSLLHLGQRERERLQERRDQVYDELQRLYSQMDQARQRAPALENGGSSGS